MPKHRLDSLLVSRGVADTKSLAQAMIMAGDVKSDTTALIKPGLMVAEDIILDIVPRQRYVSRGGDKLASVARALKLDVDDQVILDVGSSTGGFTDYVLQHGAIMVFAVDVGTAQLAYKLRQDPRVAIMEKTDIRSLPPHSLTPEPDIAVIDVSFISLTRIIKSVAKLIKPSGLIVAMAKPQFESDKPVADRFKGVISDETVRMGILNNLENSLKALGFAILDSHDSGVTGARGNRERFYMLQIKH